MVIAWKASQAKMMRASSGISSPALVRVAGAVPALVAGAHDAGHALELVDRGEDPFAELGMRPDQRPLLLGQRPGLEQDRVRDPDLADVVEERAELQPLQRVVVEAELAADAEEVSVIQRACEEVYSSRASSAFASASTVERKVRSRLA